MTIRKRTLLILGVTLIGLMIGLYVASSTLLLDSFARIEEREMAQNTQRVLDALRDRLNALNKTTRDYANWDDTYDFIQDGNAAYIESNLVNETFATNDLNLMLFVDNDGQLVYGKAIDLQNQQEIPIPPALLEQLAPASPLVRHSSVDSEVTGILSLPEGPMLVVSRPILTSQYTGPVRGALIMGRYLDAAAVEKLAALTQLGLVLKRSDDPELPADFQAMVPTLTEGSPTRTRALSADLFAAYTLLKDLTGKSSLALRVAAPRPVYQQGQLSQQYFFWAALAIALIFSLLVFLLMERSVLSRLSRLTNAVNEMAIGENSAADLIESGQADLADLARSGDEIGSLARAFSQMSDRMLSLIETLEQRVEARTALLLASADVGRAAVSILDTNQLLREIVNLITDRFGFYYTAIFTLDETEHWAELREATGEAGRVLKERQHRLEVGGQSMVGTAIATRHMRIALDTGVEAVRFANPLLPGTRSEIALPLVVGDRVLGALDVQSTQAAAFDEANAAVLQTMADQLAIALSNAEQFKQTNATLQNTRNLFAASHEISTATDSDNLLRTLIGHITPDASRAGIVMFGPRDETGHPAYFEFVTTWVHADFAATTQTIQPGARFTSEQLPVVSSVTPAQPLVVPDAGADAVPSGLRTFTHGFGAEAMIALALVAGHHPLGILIVGYRHTRTFNDDYLQTLVTLGGQAAVVLQNQLALAETQAALKQLDQANRRLTGEAWRAYAAALGGAVRVRDVVPGFQDETMPTTLDTPIVVRGEAIGTLSLEDAAPDRLWTPDEIALLQAVAGEVAVAVENARLIEQTERRAQREHIVAEISNEMFAANDIESILRTAGDELGSVLRLSRVAVRLGKSHARVGDRYEPHAT